MVDLPEEFLERLAKIVPSESINGVLASFSCVKPVAFRINTLRADIVAVRQSLELQGFELAAVSWSPTAFIVPFEQKRKLTETVEFRDGHIYIQNLASQLAPIVLDPQPEEIVLDLAAAPGGKTTQIAALMNNQGRISAVEPVKDRFFRLKANLQQQGVAIARVYQKDGRAVGSLCPEMFDRVLLDAPCSSEARFDCNDPKSMEHWSLQKVKEVSSKQKRLVRSAILSLKPGGVLVYSTCSFAPEENERVISDLMTSFEDELVVEPVELPIENSMAGLPEWNGKSLVQACTLTKRILPTQYMDGFYIAKIRKLKSIS